MKNKIEFYQATKRGNLVFLVHISKNEYVPIEILKMENGILEIRIKNNAKSVNVMQAVSLLFSNQINFFKLKKIILHYRGKQRTFKKEYSDTHNISLNVQIFNYFYQLSKEYSTIKEENDSFTLLKSYDFYNIKDENEFSIKFIKYSSNSIIFLIKDNENEFKIRITAIKNHTIYMNIYSSLEDYNISLDTLIGFIKSCFKKGNKFFGVKNIILKDDNTTVNVNKDNINILNELFEEAYKKSHEKLDQFMDNLNKNSAIRTQKDIMRLQTIIKKINAEIPEVSTYEKFKDMFTKEKIYNSRYYKFMALYTKLIEYISNRTTIPFYTKPFYLNVFFKLNILPEFNFTINEFYNMLGILSQIWKFYYLINSSD